jgi:acyl-CoA dehydrogenase
VSAPQTASDAESSGEMLRAATAEALREIVTDEARAAVAGGVIPDNLWSALEDIGLPNALSPEGAGGFGVPVVEALSLLKVAGEYALPLPLADTMLARFLLGKAGLDAPKGVLTVALGAELTIGSNGRASGRARNVPWGRYVDSVVVVTETANGPIILVVPRSSLDVEPGVNIAGDPRDTVRFEGLATSSAPFDALRARAAGAATRSLMMAGALHAVAAMTTQYAEERKQFGRAIGRFQAIQQTLAVLAGQAASAGVAADIAADAVASWGEGLAPAVAAAKIRCGEAAGAGAAIAHQVHGAIGFTQEHRLHHHTRRLWAWRDEFGREAEWAQLLGEHLAAAGATGLWRAIAAV